MTMRDYLQALRKQWWLVALVTLAVAGGIVAWSMTSTPIYRSTSTLYFSLPTGTSGTDLNSGSTYTQSQMLSYAELATQPVVLDSVIKTLGLDTTPAQLAKSIEAKANKDTVLLNLTASDPSARQAQGIAEELAGEVRTRVVALAPRDAAGRSTIEATITAHAQTPRFPSSPNTRRNGAAGFVGGLALGIVLVLARSRLDTRVRESSDLALFDTPLLGEVRWAKMGQGDLAMRDHQHTPTAESYRRVATNLGFIGVGKGTLVLTVTSALPGEGKSTTAINLALALAEAKKRVLLVEADLRRPSFADKLGLIGNVGLTSLLMGEATMRELIQPLGADTLDVITSGDIPPNPSVLLGSSQMADFLKEARSGYDVVVVDAAPLLPVTDTALLAPETSGVLLVARAGKVHQAEFEDALRSVEQVDVPVLGVVLNAVKSKGRSPYYSYRQAKSPLWARRSTRPVEAKPGHASPAMPTPQMSPATPPSHGTAPDKGPAWQAADSRAGGGR
jgi:capsular exopolysaccharide synthesis family protein